MIQYKDKYGYVGDNLRNKNLVVVLVLVAVVKSKVPEKHGEKRGGGGGGIIVCMLFTRNGRNGAMSVGITRFYEISFPSIVELRFIYFSFDGKTIFKC